LSPSGGENYFATSGEYRSVIDRNPTHESHDHTATRVAIDRFDAPVALDDFLFW
jgi:hypothetical protein